MKNTKNNENNTMRYAKPGNSNAFSELLYRFFKRKQQESGLPQMLPSLALAFSEWTGICGNCGSGDESERLSASFRYLMALKLCDAGMPLTGLRKLLGDTAADALCEAVSSGRTDCFRIGAERVFLSVSGLEKSEITEYLSKEWRSVSAVLSAYLEDIREDEGAVLAFEKYVLSLETLYDADRMKLIDFPELLRKFESPDLLDILRRNNRVHSPLLAKASLRVRSMDPSAASYGAEASKLFSDAFADFLSLSMEDREYRNIAWIKFANAAESYTNQLPLTLLSYVSVDNYREIACLLKSHGIKLKSACADFRQRKNAEAYEVAVYEKILREIDENDVPGNLRLGNIQLQNGQFDAARAYFRRVCARGVEKGYSGITAMLSANQKEIKHLLKERRSCSESDALRLTDRIRALNQNQERLFQKSEKTILERLTTSEEADPLMETAYVSLISMHSRYEKDRGFFEEANRLLSAVPATYAGYSRIIKERGLLCQTSGTRYSSNPFYNPEKAVELLREALSLLDSEATDLERKSILIPLANTYFNLGRYGEAKSVCALVLRIDRKDPKALALLKSMDVPGCGDAA